MAKKPNAAFDELASLIQQLTLRVEALEVRPEQTATEQQLGDLFGAVAKSAEPPVKAMRVVDVSQYRSAGCSTKNACTHSPCLCRMAYGL